MDIVNSVQKPKGYDDVTHKRVGAAGGGKSKESAAAASADGIEISGEARELKEMAVGLRSQLEAIPDTREDKIREITVRLSNGYYDRPEVLRALADKLVGVLAR